MTSHPEFNAKTTGTTVAAAFGKEIKGKNVVITGVSPSGIGAPTALAFASQTPATLILASRTQTKLDAVAADIKAKYPHVLVKLVELDLSSVESITSCAAEITSTIDRLDILINNAGITLQTRDTVYTPGGIKVDLQFFTNHVGPFLLTDLLLPLLLASEGSRIVNVSSHGHRLSPIRFSDYALEGDLYDGVPEDERPPTGLAPGFLQATDGYHGFIGYGQSKTANILHASELKRRFQKKGANVLALSVHPGTIDTGLSRNLDEQGRSTLDGTAPAGVWKSIDQGAATTIVAAFDPKLADGGDAVDETCLYLADCQLANEKLAPHARDAKCAQRLWDQTEKMLGIVSAL
ncbi:hypothetical protein BGZ61DRAFT_535102 [Ilyonectria robusta]|uniref:uncharacterized protein n=1 Tax=Ilyonectria robusta TaxID=1079257 RepID=UPI001E8ED875|nr:uncharacterized protein BGZ61DRAFT_535102 [Ilyonectria robusta]KAH8683680.1 hypothetical protein BGZ61DRAFT_535102 [Ilyonectria robusta]